MFQALTKTTSWLATAARAGRASAPGSQASKTPQLPLILYEYEGCPTCRRVREALTDLALPVEVRPCPRRGERFRPEAIERSGKRQFPFLIDPNAGVELLDSERIVQHLYDTYGRGGVPGWLRGAGFALTSQLASLARGSAGMHARASREPARPLQLRCNESDPAARRVRELLCELELPHVRTPGALRLDDPHSGESSSDVQHALGWLTATFAA
jgi:glutaredoxin